jgi:pimeloyl-ACP methyl ester carboxylesterase
VGLDVVERARPAELPALVPAVPMRSDALTSAAWVEDAAVALVNAAIGDTLGRRGNGLDEGMLLRAGDHYVAPEDVRMALSRPARRTVLFVHGLGTTEWSWCLEAHAYHGDPGATFGSLLERDLGVTPLWVRYNTGRHISENGRALAALLERLVPAYPGGLEELVLVGHSMGGLVIRSACHQASEQRMGWLGALRRVFCLGSPHRGAPLEKAGNVLTGVLGAIDHPATLIPARLLRARSSGIKDLRHGSLVDADWLGRDPDALLDDGARAAVPLLSEVAYHFVSSTVTEDPEHPLGQLVGDLLVRVPSASGPVVSEGHFAIDTRRFGGVLHHHLQNHPAVYEVIRDALAEGAAPVPAAPERAKSGP